MQNPMIQEARDNGVKFYTTKNESLKEVIRSLHDNVYPTDYIYELTSDIIDYFIESMEYTKDIEQAFKNTISADSLYPVYTGEINKIFADLSVVLEHTYDEWSEYYQLVIGSQLPTPNDYMQSCVYAYINWALYSVANWCQENFNIENEEVTNAQE